MVWHTSPTTTLAGAAEYASKMFRSESRNPHPSSREPVFTFSLVNSSPVLDACGLRPGQIRFPSIAISFGMVADQSAHVIFTSVSLSSVLNSEERYKRLLVR
jgi:hypothetical protein